jgi:hypothetical protein
VAPWRRKFSRLSVLFICYGTAVEDKSLLNRSGICDRINRCNIFLFMQPFWDVVFKKKRVKSVIYPLFSYQTGYILWHSLSDSWITYNITNLACYTYFHWFFNPECQHIFGKQTGYISTVLNKFASFIFIFRISRCPFSYLWRHSSMTSK